MLNEQKIMIVVYGVFKRNGSCRQNETFGKRTVQEGNDLYFYTNDQICVEMLSHPEWHVQMVHESNALLQIQQDIKS